MHPPPVGGYSACVDSCHIEDVLKEALEALDFAANHVALFSAVTLLQPGRLQILCGDTNGRERRAQVMRKRGEERGFQRFTLAR